MYKLDAFFDVVERLNVEDQIIILKFVCGLKPSLIYEPRFWAWAQEHATDVAEMTRSALGHTPDPTE